MGMIWIILVLIYGISKGLREVFKKKALEKSSTIEVLFLYTFISFLCVFFEIRNAWGVPAGTLGLIAVKSLMIFVAWIAGFTAVKHMAVGLYGLLDQLRVVFAMLLGVFVMHEHMGAGQIIGLILVLSGLLLLRFLHSGKNLRHKTDAEKAEIATASDASDNAGSVSAGDSAGSGNFFGAMADTQGTAKYVAFVVISCLFNAVSGLLDKILMSRGDVTDGQLQFWYMLFLVIYYSIYIIVKRPGIRWKESVKNGWIWILAILFVVADRCLFIANSYPESKITVMTLIKQSSCVVTILGGRIFFKEKGLAGKLVCAAIVTAGIIIAALL